MDSGSAARALFRDRARLLGYVCALVRDPNLADDVFQDVTVLAIQKAGGIRDAGHLLRWARKTARYKALEALRARGAARHVPLDDDVLEALEAEWETAGSAESAAAGQVQELRLCIERLSVRARRILQLRYTDGKNGREVADALTINVRSVYVALSRIHKALRDCMARRRAIADEPHERIIVGQPGRR
jgi:RNA polymerase sigma-70 factor (ECF subfamily)